MTRQNSSEVIAMTRRVQGFGCYVHRCQSPLNKEKARIEATFAGSTSVRAVVGLMGRATVSRAGFLSASWGFDTPPLHLTTWAFYAWTTFFSLPALEAKLTAC